MKRWIVWFVVIVWTVMPVQAVQAPPSVSAKGAVVLEAATGTVLYQKEGDAHRAMASTTKIMTTLLLLEAYPLTKEITVTKEMVTVEGSSMGLLPGDRITVEGLCYGMMLCSGNDAANTAAMVVSGSLEKFVERMNQKAASLMMNNTRFETPSGLDGKQHGSTPYDMAILTAYALQNPTFATIAACDSIRIAYGNPPYLRTITNHNKLLQSYDGCVGVKTGFTKKAGRCLVSAATRQGATLICVTLSAPNDWNDHKLLLDYGFSCMEPIQVPAQRVVLPVVGGTNNEVTATAGGFSLLVPTQVKQQLTTQVYGTGMIYAPVKQGQQVGEYALLWQGNAIKTVPLTVQATVKQKPYVPSLWKRFWHNIKRLL